ncbi:MAG: methyltransferase domain-containing protein [Chloroflexi bacterium]|nr:methyltransferase domain-containing protein [Chloroflexota bacterium]
MKYQRDYSRLFPLVVDRSSRQRKAKKILTSIQEQLGRESLEGLNCLDLGCSTGVISDAVGLAGARVVGIDIDGEALSPRIRKHGGHAEYAVGDVGAAPFPAAMFDIVICAQVYEHTPSLDLLVQEILRVLKRGGICFFSGPNRWAIIEDHYHLPFLSWFPRDWATWLVRTSRRGPEYYEHPRSANELRQAFRAFVIRDLTPRLLSFPERYGMEGEVGQFRYLARLLPNWGWPLVGKLIPNFNWLLLKTDG